MISFAPPQACDKPFSPRCPCAGIDESLFAVSAGLDGPPAPEFGRHARKCLDPRQLGIVASTARQEDGKTVAADDPGHEQTELIDQILGAALPDPRPFSDQPHALLSLVSRVAAHI